MSYVMSKAANKSTLWLGGTQCAQAPFPLQSQGPNCQLEPPHPAVTSPCRHSAKGAATPTSVTAEGKDQ